jgi:hypothetical protein
MAIRNTKLITRNSDIVNRPLPVSLLTGEAIVNTAEGILLFSGVTSSTNEWTPAGTGSTANFFEVGSNLYDLSLRNKITKYEGASGASLVGKFLSGTTSGFVLADIADISSSTDSYITGGTYNNISDEITLRANLGRPDVVITGITDTYTTGSTLNGNILTFNTNASLSAYTVDLSTLATVDTFVTGLTYSNSLLTLNQNEGQSPINVIIDSVSGLTVGNLTAGRVVYVGAGGSLVDEAGFEYNDTTNTLLAGNLATSSSGSAQVGTGGLTVGSGGNINTPGLGDLVVHGNLTIFGDAITASTSELYIEDNTITLNYNPTTNTNISSLGAGFVIQDGDGASGDTTFKIAELNTFDNSEYPSLVGAGNRAYYTNLNDIIIRQATDTTSPTGGTIGKRVLAEDDVLDGGSY